MDIPLLYEKSTRQLPFQFKEYRILNPEYLDPRKQIIQRILEEQNHSKKGKFKPSKKSKPCFVDENLRHIKFVPGPGTYKVERSISEPQLTRLKPKVNLKLKKNTYIEQIIRDSERFNSPGVGKYNIRPASTTSLKQSMKSLLKRTFPDKYSTLDNIQTLSAEVPGAGQYNIRFIRKTKKDMRDQNYYKQKHRQEDERLRAKTARPDPCSYEPIPAAFQTFHSIQRQSTQKNRISRWQHGQIDKRPSSSGFLVSPGPAQHRLINKWVSDKPSRHSKEDNNVKLLDRLWKGRTPGVYN